MNHVRLGLVLVLIFCFVFVDTPRLGGEWPRDEAGGEEEEKKISYVNDIRFRNSIMAIIHRAIYLRFYGIGRVAGTNMKQEALSEEQTNRARR